MAILAKIQTAAEKLGYETQLYPQSEEHPLELLALTVGEDGEENKYLGITVYPLDEELEGSQFLQFFYEYPQKISGDQKERFRIRLSELNRLLPLGHFNFNEMENRIYFKYVLVLPNEKEVDLAFLNDLLDMCLFAISQRPSL
ncbi:hypothetical protein P872_10745 [Rhodonellum psychrophilum GCM71 = DSM 17998]|uniref:Uncharacterized protein n=2 Tax=Rhodonellum TaxID=336827 RepID=U5BZC8_9BACT|nr:MULTISPECIES: hypothetical protein [Rhodonellum]ERM81262.1 hypothetical protein P872_10745 [Rhodonellum psychrophilum GCM71 = DSM 17998]SDY55397.1 hypothetical protein SAMN05444412_101516 [Rhodonellum ikkaensis]